MTGTDHEVAALYFELTGKNIKGCVPCQRKDARIELKIMAKKQAQAEMPESVNTVNGYTLADKYASRPTYMFDRLIQLRDEADLKFWLARMPHALVAATPTIITPATDEPTTQNDNAITIHGE